MSHATECPKCGLYVKIGDICPQCRNDLDQSTDKSPVAANGGTKINGCQGCLIVAGIIMLLGVMCPGEYVPTSAGTVIVDSGLGAPLGLLVLGIYATWLMTKK